MAFSRIKPGNWAVNEELTSAQMNSLDIDHANAVDKTGDVLTSGTIQLTSAAKIQASIHDSIVSSTDSGISTTVSHGVSIGNDTGLVLEGATCWPAFRATRSYSRVIPPVITSISGSAGWTADGILVSGPGAAGPSVSFEIMDPHHGATITTLDVVFAVGASHSAVPATLPAVNIYRVQSATTLNVPLASPDSLSSAGSGGYAFFPTPGSGAAYYNSGNFQKWTFTADQNAVIDRSKYRYVVVLTDEGGSNSHPNNRYMYFVVTYTAIANMQFP